jgi:hypothetical protein
MARLRSRRPRSRGVRRRLTPLPAHANEPAPGGYIIGFVGFSVGGARPAAADDTAARARPGRARYPARRDRAQVPVEDAVAARPADESRGAKVANPAVWCADRDTLTDSMSQRQPRPRRSSRQLAAPRGETLLPSVSASSASGPYRRQARPHPTPVQSAGVAVTRPRCRSPRPAGPSRSTRHHRPSTLICARR